MHFPDFPSHKIVEGAIQLIPNEHKEKNNIRIAYSVTTDIAIALDRIRIMSLRYGRDSGDISDCLRRLDSYSLGSSYVRSQRKKIIFLQKKAAALFAEKDPEKKEIKRINFLDDFSKAKKKLTDFRIQILKKTKECLSE